MQKVFLVGCARSGTSWLQIMLASHPAIATVRETHLFDNYLGLLYQAWRNEADNLSRDGLRGILIEDDLDRAAKVLADRVFEQIVASKPGATIALEKTPMHLVYHQKIRTLYPTARFINIVRDPRAVVASLLAASHEPWGTWASRDLAEMAHVWLASVHIGLIGLAAYGNDVFQARYEDLHTTPEATLDHLWQWLGVAPQPYDSQRVSIERLKAERHQGPTSQPTFENRENFFRRGTMDGWQSDFSAGDIATIESIAAPFMAQLGYHHHAPASNQRGEG